MRPWKFRDFQRRDSCVRPNIRKLQEGEQVERVLTMAVSSAGDMVELELEVEV